MLRPSTVSSSSTGKYAQYSPHFAKNYCLMYYTLLALKERLGMKNVQYFVSDSIAQP
jgi:hypothetical protein